MHTDCVLSVWGQVRVNLYVMPVPPVLYCSAMAQYITSHQIFSYPYAIILSLD